MNTADIHQYNSNFSNNAISTKSIASCKCHPCLPFANDMNLRCHNLPNKRAHATAWFAPSVRSLRSSGARCVATEAVLPDQMPAHHREAHDEASITQDHKSISRIHAFAHPQVLKNIRANSLGTCSSKFEAPPKVSDTSFSNGRAPLLGRMPRNMPIRIFPTRVSLVYRQI